MRKRQEVTYIAENDDDDDDDDDEDEDEDEDDDTHLPATDDNGAEADEGGGEEVDLVDTVEVGDTVTPLLDQGDDVGQGGGDVCRTPQTPPGSTSRSQRLRSTCTATRYVPREIRI